MGAAASAIWRHPHLSVGDRITNLCLCWFSPIAGIPDKPKAFAKSRKVIGNIYVKGFRSAISKGGWRVTTLEIPRADGSTLIVELATTPRQADDPELSELVVWMHGGAYTMGTAKDSQGAELWNALRKAHGVRMAVASVEYRYAPEHPHPAAIDDCELAARFLTSSAQLARTHGYDAGRVHLWGQSAGGGLALAVGASLSRAEGAPKVASVFADCPMCRPTCDTPSFDANALASWLATAKWVRWSWAAYLGLDSLAEGCTSAGLAQALLDPRVCPHTAPNGLDGVRGVSLVVSTAKADILHDEGEQAAEAWKAAGAVVAHVDFSASHCLGWMFDRPRAKLVLSRLAALIKQGNSSAERAE